MNISANFVGSTIRTWLKPNKHMVRKRLSPWPVLLKGAPRCTATAETAGTKRDRRHMPLKMFVAVFSLAAAVSVTAYTSGRCGSPGAPQRHTRWSSRRHEPLLTPHLPRNCAERPYVFGHFGVYFLTFVHRYLPTT